MKKKEDSLSLQRLKAVIAKRNKKVMTESKKRRLVLAKLAK
jgi:hypothetical protein